MDLFKYTLKGALNNGDSVGGFMECADCSTPFLTKKC